MTAAETRATARTAVRATTGRRMAILFLGRAVDERNCGGQTNRRSEGSFYGWRHGLRMWVALASGRTWERHARSRAWRRVEAGVYLREGECEVKAVGRLITFLEMR